ncbi:Beach domain-containing protein b [Heracleum sosnowskyi]|uniref:Beach domain-containing protein b n=1 Tax=Heracleum sosnowskyi TaxID=360622 RepID=A0AAD8J1H4_9APIA|nr:Beach domain-containing protein b [Heracleum sosnowskyi]
MNIVRGIVHLIRRSSTGQTPESGVGSSPERFLLPSTKILFSGIGDEAILSALWEKHIDAFDKVERQNLFLMFLKQFIIVYKNWKPVDPRQSPQAAASASPPVECSQQVDVIFGCSSGHPAEIVLALTEEISHITAMVSEYTPSNTSAMISTIEQLGTVTSSTLTSEGLPILDALTIVTRSMHNCNVFGYSGGIQKVTSLMKAAVVQLKTITSALPEDKSSSNSIVEKIAVLQNLLRHVVLIICSFINLHSDVYEIPQPYFNFLESSFPKGGPNFFKCSGGTTAPYEARDNWHQKAVVSVIEAGGLNWLVDLLRVMRRLMIKEQQTDMALHFLTLTSLRSTFRNNPRGQSHFRSIGGLDVLLDGLEFPSINISESKNSSFSTKGRGENAFVGILLLHVVSLEVLRESVFGNSNNLQFLCENGRIHKFASSFCAPAFFLKEYKQRQQKQHRNDMSVPENLYMLVSETKHDDNLEFHGYWNSYVVKLSKVLFSFLLELEDVYSDDFQSLAGKITLPVSSVYGELSAKWIVRVLFTVFPRVEDCSNQNQVPEFLRLFVYVLKHHFLFVLRKVLISSPSLLDVFRSPECSVLLDALEHSSCNPEITGSVARCLLRIYLASAEKTAASFKTLDAIPRVLKVSCTQVYESKRRREFGNSTSEEIVQSWHASLETCMELFGDYFSATEDARSLILHSSSCIDCLFDLFWEENLRDRVLVYILDLMKIIPFADKDQTAKLYLCSKYLETFSHVKERGRSCAELSINLLLGMSNALLSDQRYYQALFRDCQCFLQILSLLNGKLEEENDEKLVIIVLETLTCLLTSNDASKDAFRSLVGKGYLTLQSLLLDFCQRQPSQGLLNALLDMLVDGKFDVKRNSVIKNEDVILLYLSVLRKSSDSSQHHGLNLFLQLLTESISSRSSCVKAGILDFLIDWFSEEEDDGVVVKLAQLIQVTGGHSISGKDIRKIFALFRSEKVGGQYSSLLLTSILSMLNEKGPTAFFDLSGKNSGIIIKTPVHWPIYKGYSISCWLRVENFPKNGTMGLFSFLTENGRGCLAALTKDKLLYESINHKRKSVSLNVNFVLKKWQFLCLTHSVGRAFSGGSQVRCYVDGVLVSSEKCSYAKVNDTVMSCSIGTKVDLPSNEKENAVPYFKESSPFFGQIGPIYMFNEPLTSEQVQGMYILGPSYMYSFLDNEFQSDKPLPGRILDAKDGLASKISFGINAQACNGRTLFNVSPMLGHSIDRTSFEATVMSGTQLCSRRLLKQIIYCVGGVSVFFPLFTRFELYKNEESEEAGHSFLIPTRKQRLAAEFIKLIASVLDENLANQQQMLHLAGFSILGFLLQSVPPRKFDLEMLSALEYLYKVVANCGLSEMLTEDATSHVFLNPVIWVYTVYNVQREVCMFFIQQFDDDPRLLQSLCRLPRVLDTIHQFYCDNPKSHFSMGGKPLIPPKADQVVVERPSKEEVHRIRLLLLSLGEMSLRQSITVTDINALIAFFETSQDMGCIEDVLHMVIRAVSQKQVLAAFLEQISGCHMFVNILERDYEPVRLLGLRFLGKLLVGLPSHKKALNFFSITMERSKSLSDSHDKLGLRMLPIFSIISDKLFKFPQTNNLCSTLFDALLGGASPEQVLQKHDKFEKHRGRIKKPQFFLPQILPLIFRFLSGCESVTTRIKIIEEMIDFLDTNPSNIEALMDNGWNSWLVASVKLDVLKNYKRDPQVQGVGEKSEQTLVKKLFCVVLIHCMQSIKGGWQHLEETAIFLLMHSEQDGLSHQYLLRGIYEELVQRLVILSSEDSIFLRQPCRDNMLYLLKLVDDLLISEIDAKLPFPAGLAEFSTASLELDSHKDLGSALYDALNGEYDGQQCSNTMEHAISENDMIEEERWNIYDKLWIIIREMHGKGPRKLQKSSTGVGASFGKRARGLVESLNIPSAEMASAVVSGALVGRTNKTVDKAMLLRGENCPRIAYRLLVVYLCKASLARCSRCVQLVIPVLPNLLTASDEQSKSRLQLFIWSLLVVRKQYGMLDTGARFHVISHLLRETVIYGQIMKATSPAGKGDSSDSKSNPRESGALHHLIQKERVLAAVSDEVRYVKTSKIDQDRQLHDLRTRINKKMLSDSSCTKSLELEMQNSLKEILASDDSRRASFQLTYDEEQQTVADKWIHTLRTLIDERGPWSAIPFPNSSIAHWKLDKAEDAWRRRQKLRQNYHFDKKLCHPPSCTPSTEGTDNVDESKFGIGSHIPEKMKQFLLKGIRKITEEGPSETIEHEAISSSLKASASENHLDERQLEALIDNSQKDNSLGKKEPFLVATEAERSEVLMSASCVLVTPRRKLAGNLAVMKNSLHFIGMFLVEGTGGSSVFENLNTLENFDTSKPDQPGVERKCLIRLKSRRGHAIDSLNATHGSALEKQAKTIKRHRRWNISKIKAVHWTRYLLRYSAIEIFFDNSVAPAFFNFASKKDAKDIGTLIVSTRNEFMFPKGYKDKSGVISFVDRRVAMDMAETYKESWRRRDITNFEYLMRLNTLAGRTYNDLTQYPVFPWVLADYSSESLDFSKSSTFRDLAKPVGALDSKRFKVFEDRSHSFSDPDIPNFYYGSHYSSMGIVLFYLLRLEPFTSMHRSLQGGKFDHADRLFHSIEVTYRNCLSSTSDVKELVPEFFYMPEFLLNSNSYHFGVKQDGKPLADVCLPPWAKGSPEEFISRNREALESEYVSSNLHHWIDLVFGYKQRGKPAAEAANVFYYLTYEGAVDLDLVEDELQRSAIEDQIANFGQTPIQIFLKKHPRRGPPVPIAHPLHFAPGSINLTSIVSSRSEAPSAVVHIGVHDSNIVLVDQGQTMSVKIWLTPQLQSAGNFTFSSTQDPIFGIGSEILSSRKIGSPLAEYVELGAQCFATMQTTPENFLISCGNWENSFQVMSLSDGRMVQSIRQHKDVVSCVAVTSDGSILATGSYDTTIMLWDVVRARTPERRSRIAPTFMPRKDHVIAETPFHILCGHDDVITCLYVSAELDAVISGSKDGTCIVHTVREGRYVRSLRNPSGSPLSKLVASRHGQVVFYADEDLSLHLYSINGKHLATSVCNGRLHCVELSTCGEFLLCAGDQGNILVRSMKSLEVVTKYNGVGKIITSLTMPQEECILAGTNNGCLLVYSIQSSQLQKTTGSRHPKHKGCVN